MTVYIYNNDNNNDNIKEFLISDFMPIFIN